jgi:hypothetical protein
MAYKKVVEMLGERLASVLGLLKKWLIDWSVDTDKLLHFAHQMRKEDLLGLLNGTHKVLRAEEGNIQTPSNLNPLHSIIIRQVKVDITLTNHQAIRATGRCEHLNDEVVKLMPQGAEKEVEVHLVPVRKTVPIGNLEAQMDKLGYKLADLRTLAALNAAEPDLADKKSNGTVWRDSSGKFCYAIFYCDDEYGMRHVDVNRRNYDWLGIWFVGCVCK